jgi:type III restriction enzyme
VGQISNLPRQTGSLSYNDKFRRNFDPNNPRAVTDEQFEHFVSGKDWFAFATIYGANEEKAFVRMLDRQMQKLQSEYEQIYLLRNEGHFAIYNFADDQAFQPDFVLFLQEITQAFQGKTLSFESKRYRLIGVPFYNNEDENEFRVSLGSALN